LGPSGGLLAIGVYYHGEFCNWRVVEEIIDAITVSYLIIDVTMELPQVCGPPMMEAILQFSLCLHELQWIMIDVDDYLLPENVMPPLAEIMHNGVHFFVVISVLMKEI
jgi:hypothetical protein